MKSTPTHLIQEICAPIVVKITILSIDVIEKMVFLIILLPDEEEEAKLALVKET